MQRQVTKILLDARSNGKGVGNHQRVVDSEPAAVPQATTSKRPLSDAGASDGGILASEDGGPEAKKARLLPPITKHVPALSRSHPAAYLKFRDVFQETPKPSKERIQELAREFDLPLNKLSCWFKDQRRRQKREKA